MKQGSTFFLRTAVILMGIPVLALCIFELPQLMKEAIGHIQPGAELAYMIIGVLTVMYVSAIPFYFALYQALRLLHYIDKSQAFTELSVISLRKIKSCALIISGLYVVALPFIFIIAEWDDAPGLVLIGMVIVGASLVIAVFAAVLERLLQEAITIKSENDLTV
jgi:hypothetical protein